jgi:hypothetical protein
MNYPVVRPSITLAYSTLWRPNGRELHSTPLKWSNDQLKYHGFLLYLLFPVCEESPQLGVSRPYNKDQSESARVREGSNTHKSTAIRTHIAKTWAQMNNTKFTTRTELKSLRMSIECAKTECEWLRVLKVCLVFSSMCLGVPFIAPRQLGAVESNPGRQSLPSVGWHTGQSGAPPDRHCSVSGADCFPNLAQPTAEDLEPLAHQTQFGAHRTVRCSHQTVGSATRHARIARPTVGSADRWLTGQSGAPPDSPVIFSRTPPTKSRERPVWPKPAWRTGHWPVHHRTVRCTQTAQSLGCFSQVIFLLSFLRF